MMKTVNTEEEDLHIFWTTRGISMKLSGKVWFVKKLKKQGFSLSLSLENTYLEKAFLGLN